MSALRHLDSELDRPHMDTSAPLTRDGPASPSPRGPPTCEPPSSSACSPASPPLLIVALMCFNVIVPTPGLALGLAGALLIADALGWRAVAAMFDRERLITGTRS